MAGAWSAHGTTLNSFRIHIVHITSHGLAEEEEEEEGDKNVIYWTARELGHEYNM